MNRDTFLEQLANYLPHDAEELTMRDRIREFVAANDRCFDRLLPIGHITTSCWIVDPAREHALLTWHKRLDRWLQMGGHIEAVDSTLLASALREAQEESGLISVLPVSEEIFDLDVHLIPERKTDEAHYHYDVRFLFEADPDEPLVVSAESRDVAWVKLSEVMDRNPDTSMRRMVAKTTTRKA